MSVTAAEQTLPLEWQVPGGLPATPPPARHLRLVTPLEPDDHDADGSAGASARPGGLPAPAPWVARLAPAIIEVAAGERPAGQLTRWVTRDIRETLARRGAAALRHAGKPNSRSGRGRRRPRPAVANLARCRRQGRARGAFRPPSRVVNK